MAVIDKGHYQERAVKSGEGVITVGSGETFSSVVLLDKASLSGISAINVEENAKVSLCFVALPGSQANIDLDIDILGKGADVKVNGVYICTDEEKVSVRTMVHHRCAGSISSQLFVGVASGSAKASFEGRIIIAPSAQQTEAYQNNRNILLSENATVQTKPQLEIYADDVKCSHGATTGCLNTDEQFYMCSRGVPEAEAKVLQLISFAAPSLEIVGSEEERENLMTKIEESIRAII